MDIEKFLRKIESENIDTYYLNSSVFTNYSKDDALIFLFRAFEKVVHDVIEVDINLFTVDSLDYCVEWIISSCSIKDTTKFDDNFYTEFQDLIYKYAIPYLQICTMFTSWTRKRYLPQVDVPNKIISFSQNTELEPLFIADKMEMVLDEEEKTLKQSKFTEEKEKEISKISLPNLKLKIENNNFSYTLPTTIWDYLYSKMKYRWNLYSQYPQDGEFSNFTILEYKDFWLSLSTWTYAHMSIYYSLHIEDSIPDNVIIIDSFENIVQKIITHTSLLSKEKCNSILEFLIYDEKIINNSMILQPFVRLDNGNILFSPTLINICIPERNLLSLLQKKGSKTPDIKFDQYTNQLENQMHEEISSFLSLNINNPNLIFKANSFPIYKKGNLISNIDCLFIDKTNNIVLACELKWLLFPDKAREVLSKEEELDKGICQGLLALEELNSHRNYYSKLLDIAPDYISYSCVISKNTFVSKKHDLPIIKQNVFLDILKQLNGNLKELINILENRYYYKKLPLGDETSIASLEYAGYTFRFPIMTINEEFRSNYIPRRNDPCICGRVNIRTGKRNKYKNCCGKS